jgi:hypothetical protein
MQRILKILVCGLLTVAYSTDLESLIVTDADNNSKLNRPVDQITRKTCPFKKPPPNKGNLRINSRCGGIMSSISFIPEEVNGEFSIVQRFTWEGNIGNNLCFESSGMLKDKHLFFETESYEVTLVRLRSHLGVDKSSRRSMDIYTRCQSHEFNFKCHEYIADMKNKLLSEVKQFDEYYPPSGVWKQCGFCRTFGSNNNYVTLLKLNYKSDDFLEMRVKVKDPITRKELHMVDVPNQPLGAISSTTSIGAAEFSIDLVKSNFRNPLAGKHVVNHVAQPNELWSGDGLNTAGGPIDKSKAFWALHASDGNEDARYNRRNCQKFENGDKPRYHKSTSCSLKPLPELGEFTRWKIADSNSITFFKDNPLQGNTITLTGTLRTKITKVYRVSGQITDFSCIPRPSDKDVQWFECKVEAVAQPGATMMYLYEPNSCNSLGHTQLKAEIGSFFRVDNKLISEDVSKVKICTEYGICKDFRSRRVNQKPDQIHHSAAEPITSFTLVNDNFFSDFLTSPFELLKNVFGESFSNWYNWFLIAIFSIVGISILVMVCKCYLSRRSSAAVIKIEQKAFRKPKDTQKRD